MSTAAASATIFFLYGLCALVLTGIVIRRMLERMKVEGDSTIADKLLQVSRVGILVLTIGTMLDNFRTFAGSFPNLNPENDFDIGVSWICTVTHEMLASVSIVIPLQFVYTKLETQLYKDRAPYVAVVLVGILFVIGLVGFVIVLPNPLIVNVGCSKIDQTIYTLLPKSNSPTGLVSVIAYTFGMIFAGIFLVCREGCKSWWTLFLVANVLCQFGQALLTALGPGYECYGSNFWEQVTFITAVVADGELNKSSAGEKRASAVSKSGDSEIEVASPLQQA